MSAEDGSGGLLRDHHDGHDDEGTGDLGEHGGVDDAEAAGAADLEVAVQHGHRVVVGADLVGARGVMSPGLLLDPLEQLLVRVVLLGRPEDGRLAVDVGHLLEELHRHAHALDHGLGVLVGVLLGETLVQVMEGDDGRVAGVGAGQLDRAGVVAGVSLEHEPRPPGLVVGRRRVGGVAGVEAGEQGREAADPQILLAVVGVAGRPDGAAEDLVGGVRALGGAQVLGVDVLGPARVVLGVQVRAVEDTGEVGGVVAVHADFQTILEVVADTGEVDEDRDLELLESAENEGLADEKTDRGDALPEGGGGGNILFLGANTGELEDLGRVEGTAGKDDFLGSPDGAGDTSVLGSAGAGVGSVEGLAVEIFDTVGLRLLALVLDLVEGNLGDQGVQGDVKGILLGAVPVPGSDGVVDVITGRRAAIVKVVHVHGELGEDLQQIALGIIEIDVLEKHRAQGISDRLRHIQRQQLCVWVDIAPCIRRSQGRVDGGVQGVGIDAEGLGSTHQSSCELDILGSNADGVDSDIDIAVHSVALLAGDLVFEMLKLLEVLAHVVGRPGRVMEKVCDIVEVIPAGKQAHQGVVLGATTQTTIARVEGTKNLRAFRRMLTTCNVVN